MVGSHAKLAQAVAAGKPQGDQVPRFIKCPDLWRIGAAGGIRTPDHLVRRSMVSVKLSFRRNVSC